MKIHVTSSINYLRAVIKSYIKVKKFDVAAKLTHVTQVIALLYLRYEELKGKLMNVEKIVQVAEAKIIDLTNQVTKAQADVVKAQSDAQAQVATIQSQLTTSNSQVATLTQQLQDAQGAQLSNDAQTELSKLAAQLGVDTDGNPIVTQSAPAAQPAVVAQPASVVP